jgi:hypothetical protein
MTRHRRQARFQAGQRTRLACTLRRPRRNAPQRKFAMARAYVLPSLFAKSIQPRYIPSDDQGMNVVCAFVGEDTL